MAEPALRLLPDSGEVPEDAPQTYAEALVALDNLRQDHEGAVARGNRLAEENEHLTTALGKAHGQVQRLKSERNKDLRLHKDYATVERVYLKWRALLHPKAQEKIPDDRLKLGLERHQDFDEAHMSRAIDGAVADAYVDDKGVRHDSFDFIFRSTENVWKFIKRADAAEGRAQVERKRVERDGDPKVAQVLAALGVASLRDLESRCDNCGELMIRHGAPACADPDDHQFRADRWLLEQADRYRRGMAVSDQAMALLRIHGFVQGRRR